VSYIDPGGKLLAHLPRLAMLQAGGVPDPINIEIDLSNRCSLGCEWCHFAYTHTRGPLKGKREKPEGAILGGDLMDTDLAFSILDQIAGRNISVTWTGGGEPTLHPDFDNVVRYAHERGIEQAIYTHGGHLDTRHAFLRKALRFIYVSLDATNAEDYKRDKGVDRFWAVIQNLDRLANDMGDAVVGVGFLVTEKNWRKAGEAVDLAMSVRANYIQFRPTILYDMQHPTRVTESTDWMEEAIPYLDQVHKAHPGFVEIDLDRFTAYRDWDGHGYPTCWWSTLQTCITPNGKMWTCVNLREHPGAELGDLSVEGFDEIWGRRPVKQVDSGCRVLCRGHVANQALDKIMAPHEHGAFV
jgi:GTP 3',8-cyclase